MLDPVLAPEAEAAEAATCRVLSMAVNMMLPSLCLEQTGSPVRSVASVGAPGVSKARVASSKRPQTASLVRYGIF